MNTKYLNIDILFNLPPLTPWSTAYEITGDIQRVLYRTVGHKAHEIRMEIAIGGIHVTGIIEITRDDYDDDILVEAVMSELDAVAMMHNMWAPSFDHLVVQNWGAYE